MRLATVDIGTNSVLLLIVERSADGALQVVEEACLITRLGQGVDHARLLRPAAIERTLAALATYAARLSHWRVTRRAAVGTSALRDATNGAAFLAEAATLLGCPVEVISGLREAQLVLRGVSGTQAGAALEPGTVVIDVGGGSTELIAIGAEGALRPPLSLDLGSVRLTERYLRHDPPTADELAQLRHELRCALTPITADLPSPPARLIGVAGTVTTLAAIALGLDSYDGSRVDGVHLTLAQIDALAQRLARLPLEQRRTLPGLPAQRADVIVAGAILVAELLRQLRAESCAVSDRGVRWGLARELAAAEA